jgi:hypothetical protein
MIAGLQMVSLRDQRHIWSLRGHRSLLPEKYVLLQRHLSFALPMGLSHMAYLGDRISLLVDQDIRL